MVKRVKLDRGSFLDPAVYSNNIFFFLGKRFTVEISKLRYSPFSARVINTWIFIFFYLSLSMLKVWPEEEKNGLTDTIQKLSPNLNNYIRISERSIFSLALPCKIVSSILHQSSFLLSEGSWKDIRSRRDNEFAMLGYYYATSLVFSLVASITSSNWVYPMITIPGNYLFGFLSSFVEKRGIASGVTWAIFITSISSTFFSFFLQEDGVIPSFIGYFRNQYSLSEFVVFNQGSLLALLNTFAVSFLLLILDGQFYQLVTKSTRVRGYIQPVKVTLFVSGPLPFIFYLASFPVIVNILSSIINNYMSFNWEVTDYRGTVIVRNYLDYITPFRSTADSLEQLGSNLFLFLIRLTCSFSGCFLFTYFVGGTMLTISGMEPPEFVRLLKRNWQSILGVPEEESKMILSLQRLLYTIHWRTCIIMSLTISVSSIFGVIGSLMTYLITFMIMKNILESLAHEFEEYRGL